MIPEDNRFESDPEQALDGEPAALPDDWQFAIPDAGSRADVAQLLALLRAHEERGRGWASSGEDDVLLETGGAEVRENLVIRDEHGTIRAWGTVNDRAGGRMVYSHVVDRELAAGPARACSELLLEWAESQARTVAEARGVEVQQIDCSVFADDTTQQRVLERAGFARVRSWWQMTRPVEAGEVDLVSDPAGWEADGVRVRVVRRGPDGLPDVEDLREVHEVLESAFVDHFNSHRETFWEFIHRLREEPGHAWDHWWLAELLDGEEPVPVGTLVGSVSHSEDGPDGSYVEYLGVLSAARGRGVAKGLLHTAIADAAQRGRPRIGIEVDADSPTGAQDLYLAMGWQTRYVTESWHRDIVVGGDAGR
ncbi:GNAT family N-acetyltransferase [Nocardioides panacisoli]|uniref:GNAT family N-acetyltransferase n=1 Tax=Nocardioides panacisoli TaxID=627624 RepID=UPI001C633AED|nr:GNAT family N-acetyltransferase [Nocardioides panacisoli]QYJ03728.1 GNAT family N-acetyltransferase [Nocardioides panacisoli]